jgi:hypothetical protein
VTDPDELLAPPLRGGAGSRGPLNEAAPRDPAEFDAASDGEMYEDRSLLEDLHALYEDGKTYAAAELTFQKTRASFVADKAKSLAIFGGAAALTGLLALIGLTVGAILSLATLIGPLAATLVVVGVLLIVAFLCARKAGGKLRALMSAFGSGSEKRP